MLTRNFPRLCAHFSQRRSRRRRWPYPNEPKDQCIAAIQKLTKIQQTTSNSHKQQKVDEGICSKRLLGRKRKGRLLLKQPQITLHLRLSKHLHSKSVVIAQKENDKTSRALARKQKKTHTWIISMSLLLDHTSCTHITFKKWIRSILLWIKRLQRISDYVSISIHERVHIPATQDTAGWESRHHGLDLGRGKYIYTKRRRNIEPSTESPCSKHIVKLRAPKCCFQKVWQKLQFLNASLKKKVLWQLCAQEQQYQQSMLKTVSKITVCSKQKRQTVRASARRNCSHQPDSLP